MPDLEQYHTVDEVAAIFAVTPHTIRNWIKDGKLKALKIGRILRVSDSNIQELAEEKHGPTHDSEYTA